MRFFNRATIKLLSLKFMSYEIIEEYSCGHECPVHTLSKDLYASSTLTSSNRQPLSPKSSSPKIFASITKKLRLPSNTPPRYRPVFELCHICKAKENAWLRLDRERGPWDLAEVEERQKQRAKYTMEVGKARFLCKKCQTEGRPDYGIDRAVNSGLCCENGRTEWERMQELRQSGMPSSDPSYRYSLPARAESIAQVVNDPVIGLSRKDLPEGQARTSGQAQVRDCDITRSVIEVRRAGSCTRRSNDQTKKCDPRHLEPRSAGVMRCVHTSQGTGQGISYVDPHIDLDLWRRHPQTSHGRIPNPPENALPVIPGQRDGRGRGRDTIHRKPLQQKVHPNIHSESYQTSPPGAPQLQNFRLAQQPKDQQQRCKNTVPQRDDCPTRMPPGSRTFSVDGKLEAPPLQLTVKEKDVYASKERNPKSPSRPMRDGRWKGPASVTQQPTPAAPPRPLRRVKGHEWHDAQDLAARASPLLSPQAHNPLYSCRLTSPFPQPQMRDNGLFADISPV